MLSQITVAAHTGVHFSKTQKKMISQRKLHNFRCLFTTSLQQYSKPPSLHLDLIIAPLCRMMKEARAVDKAAHTHSGSAFTTKKNPIVSVLEIKKVQIFYSLGGTSGNIFSSFKTTSPMKEGIVICPEHIPRPNNQASGRVANYKRLDDLVKCCSRALLVS